MGNKRKNLSQIKSVLRNAQEWCDDQEKSTGFMIAYMCDQLTENLGIDPDVTHDIVMEYLCNG